VGAAAGLLVAAAAVLGDVPSLSVVRTEALLAKVLLSLSHDHSGLRNIPSLPVIREKALLAEFLLSFDKIAVEQEGVQA
jgi:hypothetical protein